MDLNVVIAWAIRLTAIMALPVGAASASTAGAHAVEILPPPNAASNPLASLLSVGCAGAGSCAAGGIYLSRLGVFRPMVAVQSQGRWARGIELLLPPDAPAGSQAAVTSLACPGARSCVAVGWYIPRSGARQGFLAAGSQQRWTRATPVSLPANAAAQPNARLLGVSCTGSGSCTAVGSYLDRSGAVEGLAVAESQGRWGRARETAAPANAAADPQLTWNSVACTGPGSCVAVGYYRNRAGFYLGAVAVEASGRWGRAAAARMPSDAGGQSAALFSVACPRAGSCTTAGYYQDRSARQQAMADTQTSGRWQDAVKIGLPGDAAASPAAALTSVSCTGPGSCAGVGAYTVNTGHRVAMVAGQVNGRWRRASPLQAPANAGTGANQFSYPYWNTCLAGQFCIAVGTYYDTGGDQQAMAVTTRLP